ncbi:MAG: autotransporter-associated beta strand repeat-containing protein [Candidatus Paceibacterota bacterium]
MKKDFYINLIKFSSTLFVFVFLFLFTTNAAEAAVKTWTGSTSDLWSVGANWGGDVPVTGDDLVFPDGTSNLSSTNDLTENTIFNSITFSGSGYTLSGNSIILGPGLAGITDVTSSGGNTIAFDIRLDVTRDIYVTNINETLTISGRIAGVGGINKEGEGKLILSGANTYGGITKVNVGVLNAQNDKSLGTILAGTEVVGNAVLELQGGINISYEALALRGYGVSENGALRNISGNNTYGGLITLSSAGGTEISSDADTLTITGGMTGAFPLFIDGPGNITYSTTPIAIAAGTVTKKGSGTLRYNFPNTYTGLTIIDAGTLLYGTNNAILSGGVTVTGGTLDISNYSDMLGTVTLGTLDLASGTITGTSGVLSSPTWTVYNGSINAIISGYGGTLTKSTPGTVVLGRANRYTGATSINGGILEIQDSSSLGTIDGITTVSGGSTLQINGDGMLIPEYIAFSGTGHLYKGAIRNKNGNNTLSGLLTTGSGAMIVSEIDTILTIDERGVSVTTIGLTVGGAGDVVFTDDAPIYGTTGTLTKNDEGLLTINSFSNITGVISINRGDVVLSGLGALPIATTIFINAGATLTLDNTSNIVNDRIADTAVVTMNGGNFNFKGSSSGDVLETTGVLTSGIATQSGDNKITITPGSGGSTVMRFASLIRTAGSSLLFRGTSLGSTPAANVSTLLFTTAPTLLGDDGESNSPTLSIIPGAFGDNSLTGTGTDMVTYNKGNINGLRLLNGIGFTGEYTSDINRTNGNVKLTSSISATTSLINSLILSSGSSITNPSTSQNITLTSGNILNLVNGANIAGANTTLIMDGNVEGFIRAVEDIDFSSSIATTGGFTKTGEGTLTFSRAQTYTGLTSVNEGTFLYGIADTISSGNVTVNGGILDIANFNDTVGAVILQKGTITGSTGVLSGASYNLREGTVSAILGGGVTLTRIATNTAADSIVALTRENSYTGVTTITSGILKIGAAGNGTNSPLGTIASGTTIANIAALDLNGYTLSTTEAITSLNGSGFGPSATVANGNSVMGALMNSSGTSVSYNGNIALGSASRINADFGTINITGNISGAFGLTIGGYSNTTLAGTIGAGALSLTKDGIGTLTLSGSNSYTGATTVSSGTIKLGATGSGSNTPLGTTGGTTTVATGSRFDLNGFTLATAETITLNGVGYGIGNGASGALINSSVSSVTYSGQILLGSTGTMVKADYGDINLTAAGTITGANFGLILAGSGNGTLSSIIGTTSGTVTKIGSGMWTLSGSSTYTGATNINIGTLRLGATGGATNTPLGTIGSGTVVSSGAVLDLNGYTLGTVEGLTINGRGIGNGGVLINNSISSTTYPGGINQATDSRIANSGAGLLTLSGAVSGAFTLQVGGAGSTTFSTAIPTTFLILRKQGAGTLTLTGTNLNIGGVIIDEGTLTYGAATTLAATPMTVLGGTFNMNGTTDAIGAVTLIGGNISNGTLTSATSYTLESGTVSAILAGAVPVIKNTNNTVVLSGVNTISSTTTINAGTLTISGSGSATATTITVNLGGTLTLDNSSTAVASRLGDAIALTMNGGNYNFIGNSAGASSETTGALTLLTGHNTVTVTPGSGGSTTMTFASLSRTAGATVLFRGTGLGTASAANISTLVFTATPTLTGGGGASGSTTVSVIKGAYGDSSLSGTGSDMVTYQGGTGLRLLNGAGFSGEYATNLSTANANVKLTASATATTTNTNSLILNGFSVTDPGVDTTLPIASASLAGNILINSANDIAGSNTTLGITTFELPILATSNGAITAKIGTATSGVLTLSGSGNVTLSAANLYNGLTYINGATLTYGVSNAISTGGVVVRGGLYDLNGNSDIIGSLSLTAASVATASGTLTLGGDLTSIANGNFSSKITGNLDLGFNRIFNIGDGLVDNDLIVSAIVSGAFNVTKSTGTGVLVFSGDNTYTGSTTISAGTLRLGANGGVTNTPLGTTLGNTIVSGASSALDLNGFTLGTAEPLTLTGALATGALQNTSSDSVTYSGLITLGAASTIISNYGDINISNGGNITGNTFGLTIGGAGNGTLFSNLNTGTGTLTKNGLGVWTISGGASTYTGLTTISAGTLKLGSAGSGVNTPLGTVAGGVTVTSGAIFDLNGFTLATAEPIGSLNGTGIANIGALINSSSNTISFTGTITLGAASRVVNYGNGVLTLAGNIGGNFALTLVTVGGITQSSNSIRSGTSTIIKEGSGTLILTGQNTFTGAVTVSTGVLQLGASGGATNTPLGTSAGGVVVSTGAVLDLSTYSLGGASTYETLNLSGTGIGNGGVLISTASGNNNFGAVTVAASSLVVNNGSGTITFGGTITIANSINLSIGGTGPTTISGAYGATATSATLTKWDSGTLSMGSVASITTGLVRINGGTIKYGINDSFATPFLTIAGGTLDLNGFNETNIGAVTLIDGSIVNTGGASTLTSTTTYTVENGTISAVLAGAAIAFNKNTGGTVSLSAANTFAGLTSINAGTLAWGINDALSSGALTVTGGIADLGTHTDTVGTATLTSGSIKSSTGILTATSYAVASGSIGAILAGAVNLTKTTVGLVTLSGNNTYTGITTISGGTLSVSNIGNGGVVGNLGQATNAAANIVFNTGTGTLQYTGSTASTDRSYTTTTAITTNFDITNPGTVLTWSGAGTVTTAIVTKIGQGTLKFSASQGHTGATNILAGTLQYGVANMLSTGTVNISNGILDINNFSDSVGVITLQNAGSIIDSGGTTAVLTTTGTGAFQSGFISARLGGSISTAITKSTNGRVVLSGDNTFTGTIISLFTGYLSLLHNNALGASGTSLGLIVTSGAVLELNGDIMIPSTKAFTINGSGVNNLGAIRNVSGANTIMAFGNFALGSNSRINSDSGSLTIPTISGNSRSLTFGGAGDITVTGAISTTSGTLTKEGSGVLTLTGTNTYYGTTTLTLGTIIANSTSSLGDGSATNTLIFNGGTLKASGTITSPVDRTVTLAGNATIDTNGNNVSIAGTVGSAGGLTKNGAGTLTLTGVTTIGNGLTIDDGTFVAPTSLTITGDLTNSGTFTHSNGTVVLNPNAINSTANVFGSSNTIFYNFTYATANSNLKFKAGNTYTFTNLLTLTGTLGSPISLSSDTNGVQWLMVLSGSSSVAYINVRDSGCSSGNTVPVDYPSISNSGNNGWCWSFISLSGGSVSNVEVSVTPDPDQTGGDEGGGVGIEDEGTGDVEGGGGSGGGGGLE